MGSATLARALLAADLVDELLLMIEPIALGGGKTVFPTDGAARPFELVDAKVAGTGVIVCTYRPAGRGPSAGLTPDEASKTVRPDR
jgi:riboflavin biosynthesis pyrimidine reductase